MSSFLPTRFHEDPQKQAGQAIGPALLLFGVTAPDLDYLYRDELTAWEKLGIVQVLPAFSDLPDGDVRYVQDRVWAERWRIAYLFQRGAIVYVCGDGAHMAPSVRDALIHIYREATGADEAAAKAWADEVEHKRGRYVADVFA
jgi:cytochrome P450 / NADPH-cytochrome P450 reductase